MAALNLPDPYASIDALIESHDFAGARAALSTTHSNAALAELLEVKIGLVEGTLQGQLVMNRLLALMRKEPKLPGLHELYRDASTLSYDQGTSSMSHSHPPPPMTAKKPKAE